MSKRSQGFTGLEIFILALFFASGASALIYEAVWARKLTYIFGGSAFAIATVLAAYMAGLALGSAWFGKRIDRKGHPLVVYGVLEGLIGLWALFLPAFLGFADNFYAWIFQNFELGSYPLSLIRFVLCFLLLLVPTTMMGGTLPVLGKLLLNNWQGLGSRAGLLYGINTIGAVVGIAAGGFVLLPALGMAGATWLAVGINLAVAAAAVLASRKLQYVEPVEVQETQQEETSSDTLYSGGLRKAILVVYAASGFAALAYEVVWTKVLSMILGTTTYAFTSMLTTFLLGLSIGAFLFGKIADRFGKPAPLLAVVQLTIPLLSLLTIPLIERLPQFFVNHFDTFAGHWISLEMFRILLAGATMFLPTLLMGGTFPLVTRAFVDRKNMGSSLGVLYASNTVGAILGSFLTGFVFIPLIGRQNSILLATFVNLFAVALLLSQLGWRKFPTSMRALGGLVILALIPAVVLGLKPWDPKILTAGAYYYPRQIAEKGSIEEYYSDSNLIHYEESTEATISVWQSLHSTILRINGKIDASSHGDMITQKMVSHVPTFYTDAEDAETVIIGLASGISVGALLTHPIKSVDTVELIEGVDRAARFFDDYNGNCLDDPRFNLIINDGRNQLRLSDKTYDIIISEPTNPWIAGVGALFTREFFQLTKDRINPGGIVCQWVQIYHMQEKDVQAILATFTEEFPYAHLWTGNPGDLILVGSLEPLELSYTELESKITGPVLEDIKNLEIDPIPNMLSYFITDREGILEFVSGVDQRVTDDNLYLEFSIPRHMWDTESQTNLLAFDPVRKSATTILKQIPDDETRSEIDTYSKYHRIALEARTVGPPPGYSTLEEAYRDVLKHAPQDWIARDRLAHDLNERGITQIQEGSLDQAAATFREVIELGSRTERALAWNNLGYIEYVNNRRDIALTYWENSAKEEGRSPVINFNLGLLSAQSGDRKKAAEYFAKAARFDPSSAENHNSLAYNLAMINEDLERALSHSRTAVEINPQVEHRATLGFVLLRNSKFEEATGVLESVLAEKSDHHEAQLHLGIALANTGDKERSRSLLNEVIGKSTDPDLVTQAKSEMEKL
ncbi:MAG: fused MFS/spermidine synthase [Candidatus Eisenbacteria bacterium]|uniref:Fused MFS/spermidine synthase n=1 Tax=Eiseniibacteriota bacterium TaxID=2212470 RepID=A0A7Y2H1F7_UNCEI|nr:fused MFS/spermidine synthase [Candidatus Eisenbacteria bacterium]